VRREEKRCEGGRIGLYNLREEEGGIGVYIYAFFQKHQTDRVNNHITIYLKKNLEKRIGSSKVQ